MGRRREGSRDKRRRRRRSSSGGRIKRNKGAASMWDLGPQGQTITQNENPSNPALPAGVPPSVTASGGALVPVGELPTLIQGDPNARRLYVGNIVPQLSDEYIAKFFSMQASSMRQRVYQAKVRKAQEMMRDASSIPQPNDSINPVVECNVTRSDDATRPGFAFVELNDEDLCTECLSLDGRSCPLPDGSIIQLKVSRPKNYIPSAIPASATPLAGFGIEVPLPDDAPGKYILSGFPACMGDIKIRLLLDTFGVMKTYRCLTTTDGPEEKGCCLFDFDQPEDNDRVVAALNGVEVAGSNIMVQRVGSGAMVTQNKPKEETFSPSEEAEGRLLRNILDLKMNLSQGLQALAECVESQRPGLAAAVHVKQPTKFLGLINLFDEEDLEDDYNFEDIKAAIEQEVEKHGRVVDVIIPREPPRHPAPIEKPQPPPLLLPPTTGAQRATSIGVAPQVAPEGFARNPNTGMLIPIDQVDDETKKIEDENVKRRSEWESRCEEIDREREAAKKRWEADLLDPIKNGVGKVFVEYTTVEEAHEAQVALAGRQFDNRTVITSFLPEQWFRAGVSQTHDSLDDILGQIDAKEEPKQLEYQG
eukprot:TRINITY_DN2543_c1_g1_i1.p1 TRINITY_DN2543_c1_g1~~TRINITY_DN2543_c1_g1_i1.p1  ORF type:complete len:590 (+),score=116.04 TRINITY_DN2543_c1_g1_i1:47-1816(+)